MTLPAAIQVEVVYALPTNAVTLCMRLPAAATVAEALALAALDSRFSGIDFNSVPVGIFGKLATREDKLRDGDRVEIYRGPAADAKAARHARLKVAKRRS